MLVLSCLTSGEPLISAYTKHTPRQTERRVQRCEKTVCAQVPGQPIMYCRKHTDRRVNTYSPPAAGYIKQLGFRDREREMSDSGKPLHYNPKENRQRARGSDDDDYDETFLKTSWHYNYYEAQSWSSSSPCPLVVWYDELWTSMRSWMKYSIIIVHPLHRLTESFLTKGGFYVSSFTHDNQTLLSKSSLSYQIRERHKTSDFDCVCMCNSSDPCWVVYLG